MSKPDKMPNHDDARIAELEQQLRSMQELGVPEVEIFLPDWPVTCERGCDHEALLKALWPWWQFSGNRGCPACSFTVIDKDGRRSDDWVWKAATPGMFGSKVVPAEPLFLPGTAARSKMEDEGQIDKGE